MAQITLRKSTTGTVVNHKEESSLRGICNRRGGGFPIPGEAGWTEMFDDFQSACPRPSAHLYCHLETNEGVAAASRPIGRRWWRNDCWSGWSLTTGVKSWPAEQAELSDLKFSWILPNRMQGFFLHSEVGQCYPGPNGHVMQNTLVFKQPFDKTFGEPRNVDEGSVRAIWGVWADLTGWGMTGWLAPADYSGKLHPYTAAAPARTHQLTPDVQGWSTEMLGCRWVARQSGVRLLLIKRLLARGGGCRPDLPSPDLSKITAKCTSSHLWTVKLGKICVAHPNPSAVPESTRQFIATPKCQAHPHPHFLTSSSTQAVLAAWMLRGQTEIFPGAGRWPSGLTISN